MSICKHHSTAPTQTIEGLHDSQEGFQRHKCCECAFIEGVKFGLTYSIAPGGNAVCSYTGKTTPQDVMEELEESQGTVGWHKCAVCSYHEGFERGRAFVTSWT